MLLDGLGGEALVVPGDPEAPGQTGIGVEVDGEDTAPLASKETRQGRGDGRLADPALADDREAQAHSGRGSRNGCPVVELPGEVEDHRDRRGRGTRVEGGDAGSIGVPDDGILGDGDDLD